ncbi:MAG: hypothetical protein U0183_07255 [Polyangiaceae bacterium]
MSERARRAARSPVLTVAGVLALYACSRAPVEVPHVEPPRDASLAPPPAAPTADAGRADDAPGAPRLPAVLPKGVAAWTEPAALAVLAVDCRAEPAPRSEHDTTGPLSCALPFDQSCSYDPCFTKSEDCRAACGTTCQTCDQACVTTCGSCKATCKDEACTKECAAKTGACRQACLLTRDTCASAGCTEKERVCNAVEKRNWRAHGCSCKAISPCLQGCFDTKARCEERCANSKDDSCWSKCDSPKCKDACRARFRGCDVDYCATSPFEPFQDAP